MRDLLLATMLIIALPVAVARPFVGALVFAWLGLMNPHRMAWGFATTIPWALLFAIATMIGLVFTRESAPLDSLKRFRGALYYLAWMSITTILAFYPETASARLFDVAKVFLMCVVTLMLLTSVRRIEGLVLVSTLSIAYFGIKGGVFTILTGGAYRVYGPAESMIADNNQLAVALVMTIPLLYWIMRRAQSKWQRLLIGVCAVLVAASVFGSHSRGALLALAAMAAFLFAKSGRSAFVGALAVAAVLVATELMPDTYWDRMASITASSDARDWSAQSRLLTWKMATNIANSNLTGAGFDYYSPAVVARYSSEPMLAYSAHSIYFQSLGEHGWPGLTLYLLFWVAVWRSCVRSIRALRAQPDGDSLFLLLRMIQTGLIGFAVGGAFVNIGYWDFPFYLAVVVFAIERYSTAASPLPQQSLVGLKASSLPRAGA